MDFCKEFNARTAHIQPGVPTPTLITIQPDRTFAFVTKTPPVEEELRDEHNFPGVHNGRAPPQDIIPDDDEMPEMVRVSADRWNFEPDLLVLQQDVSDDDLDDFFERDELQRSSDESADSSEQAMFEPMSFDLAKPT